MQHYLKVPSIPRAESTVRILEHEVTLVGAKTMQARKITLDFDEERVNYRKTAQRLRV